MATHDPPLDHFSSATRMLEALRQREVSSVELLEMHLRRIERYDATLNAIVTPDFEQARLVAEEADAARLRGDDGALLGLPVTVKETIDVAGLRGTAGVPAFAERRPTLDALLVTRAKAAGAVIFGKTNVPPFVWDWQTNNPVFGLTRNPWDLTRTPGGSSGGGAAALAAGLTPLEYGSDMAGSIRFPAAFCGVYGHRPSDSALPHSGHLPGSPLPNPGSILGTQGPLARSIDDIELAFDVASGPEVDEATAWHLEIPPARHKRLRDFRVAVMPPVPWVPVSNDVLAAQETLVETVERTGARVARVQPDGLGDLREFVRVYVSLLHVLASGALPVEERHRQAAELRAQDDEICAMMADGYEATAADYLRWRDQRERYRAAFRDFFREWDVLLSPITLTAAFPHQDIAVPVWQRVLEVDGRSVPYQVQYAYPCIASLSGYPATAFPVGRSASGLPIGLQAMGPYLEDRTVFQFARLVAEEIGSFVSPPGYEM